MKRAKRDSLIYGVHAVCEALRSGRQPIERIYVAREASPGRLKEILGLARDRATPIRKESRSVLDRLTGGQVHQGVVAVRGEVEYASLDTLWTRENPIVIALDGVEDPHNFGAIVRTAEAAGASGLIVPERHSAPLNAAVVKASAGATAYVSVVRVANLVSAIRELKERGLWAVGLDPAGQQSWTQFDYTVPVALILGGEHQGLRRLVREHCDVLVHLPMRGKIASLNVSVAAGVILYEVVRQRHVR